MAIIDAIQKDHWYLGGVKITVSVGMMFNWNINKVYSVVLRTFFVFVSSLIIIDLYRFVSKTVEFN